MNLYHTNEADFILPAAMQDRSIHVFAYTASDPFTFAPAASTPEAPPEYSVVLTRELIPAEETVDGYATRQLSILEQNFADFTLIERQDAFVDNIHALVAAFSTKTKQGPIHQRQAYMLCPVVTLSDKGEQLRTALTLTATTKMPQADKYAFLFEQLLYSFSFRRA